MEICLVKFTYNFKILKLNLTIKKVKKRKPIIYNILEIELKWVKLKIDEFFFHMNIKSESLGQMGVDPIASNKGKSAIVAEVEMPMVGG